MEFQQVFSLIFHPKISLYLDKDLSFEFSQLQRNFSFQSAMFDAQNDDLFTYFFSYPAPLSSIQLLVSEIKFESKWQANHERDSDRRIINN